MTAAAKMSAALLTAATDVLGNGWILRVNMGSLIARGTVGMYTYGRRWVRLTVAFCL